MISVFFFKVSLALLWIRISSSFQFAVDVETANQSIPCIHLASKGHFRNAVPSFKRTGNTSISAVPHQQPIEDNSTVVLVNTARLYGFRP